MANPPIIFLDSFGHYSTATAARKWGFANFNAILPTGGRNGRGAAQYAGTGSSIWYGTLGSCLIVGCAWNFTGVPGPSNQLLLASSAAIVGDGQGRLYVSGHSGTTTPIIIHSGSWLYLDFRVNFSTTVGTVDIWADNTLVLSLSGINTGAVPTSFSLAPQLSCLVSDLYAASSNTGTDLPYGDQAVVYLPPNGAGNYTQFTPTGAATNWQAVDELVPDDDTTYVASSTVGNRDSYTLTDLPATAGTVSGVQLVADARKTDAGTRSIAQSLRIGGTDYDQTAVALGTDYLAYELVPLTNSPATGVAFTVAEVNGMEVGVKVSA